MFHLVLPYELVFAKTCGVKPRVDSAARIINDRRVQLGQCGIVRLINGKIPLSVIT